MRKIKSLIVAGAIALASVGAVTIAEPAQAYTANAYDGTQHVQQNMCGNNQVGYSVVYSATQEIYFGLQTAFRNGPYNNNCRIIDGGGWTVADTFQFENAANFYNFHANAGTYHYVLCWTTGDHVGTNGYNVWDKIVSTSNGITALGWAWDGAVVASVTWPHC